MSPKHLSLFISVALALGAVPAYAQFASTFGNPNQNGAKVPSLPGGQTLPLPGQQLQQQQQQMQRHEMNQNLQEGKKLYDEKQNEKIQGPAAEQPNLPEVHVLLKEIDFNKSVVLSKQDLDKLTAPYIGKEITIEQLYALVKDINEVYRKRGYVTAMAVLPEQKIKDGIVKIILIEGKVGEVFIQGNKSTRESYIKNRINLPKGKVVPLGDMEKPLEWFNGTNDVKLTIQLKAGKLPGTTDYVITAHEPQHHVFTIFGDTAGSYTTGNFRMGVSYLNSSVFGIRDNLSTVLLSSKNSHSALLSYSVPVNRYGTRIGANVNYNWLKIPPEKLASRGGTGLEIKGNSMSYGLSVTQPYYVTTKLKAQASLTIQRQTSKTKASGFTFVNDRETSETLATDITRYFSQQAIYVKPSFTHANYNGLDQSFGYNRFNLSAMWQYQTRKNWVFSATLSAQKALGNKMIPSSDQFYLGGMYSVRGYKENVISGDDGELLNLEARIPIFRPFDRQLTAIVFADGGHVSGDTSLSTKSIYGAGLGLAWELPWLKNSNMTFMIGHPFKKNIQDEKIDSYRMYFAINGRF